MAQTKTFFYGHSLSVIIFDFILMSSRADSTRFSRNNLNNRKDIKTNREVKKLQKKNKTKATNSPFNKSLIL